MKNLSVTILILLFTSPAFAGGNSSAFSGAQGIIDAPITIQDSPIVEQESAFKIDERLYAESIGSNGYYGGGFYGEERNLSQVAFYEVTSQPSDFGFGTGFIVVNDTLIPTNFVSPFNSGFGFFRGGVSVNIGSFSFFSRGFGRGSFGHGGFGHGSFGFRHR